MKSLNHHHAKDKDREEENRPSQGNKECQFACIQEADLKPLMDFPLCFFSKSEEENRQETNQKIAQNKDKQEEDQEEDKCQGSMPKVTIPAASQQIWKTMWSPSCRIPPSMLADPSPSFFTISKKISNSTMEVASLNRDSPSMRTTTLSKPPPDNSHNHISWTDS